MRSPRLYPQKSLQALICTNRRGQEYRQLRLRGLTGSSSYYQHPHMLHSSAPREDPQPAHENHHAAANHSPKYFKTGAKHKPQPLGRGFICTGPSCSTRASTEHTPTQAKGFQKALWLLFVLNLRNGPPSTCGFIDLLCTWRKKIKTKHTQKPTLNLTDMKNKPNGDGISRRELQPWLPVLPPPIVFYRRSIGRLLVITE